MVGIVYISGGGGVEILPWLEDHALIMLGEVGACLSDLNELYDDNTSVAST
jgi:hypothetical protein